MPSEKYNSDRGFNWLWCFIVVLGAAIPIAVLYGVGTMNRPQYMQEHRRDVAMVRGMADNLRFGRENGEIISNARKKELIRGIDEHLGKDVLYSESNTDEVGWRELRKLVQLQIAQDKGSLEK